MVQLKAIVTRTRVEIAAIGVVEAELCGGVAVEPGPIPRDGGASAGETSEEAVSVTLTLSFWPLLQ